MASKGTKFETLFWLVVNTGLREGETIGLKWSDLDWKTGKLQIQRQVQRTKEYGSCFVNLNPHQVGGWLSLGKRRSR